jgi:hypothetical protein
VKNLFKKTIKFFASVKLAVLIIAMLAVLISVGTLVEARYDAWTAKNWVYGSVWMHLTLGLLTISLISVIVDRWPWKPKHASFILAHVGIITIIYGSLLTQLFGIDGTIRLTRTSGPAKDIVVQETEINVFRSRDGNDYEKVVSLPVNFLKNPIPDGHPFLIKAKGLHFEILASLPFALPQERVEPSKHAQSGAALRFQLTNANVSQIDWMVQRNAFDRVDKQMGPLLLTLGGLWQRSPEINEIRFFKKNNNDLGYMLFQKAQKRPTKTGSLRDGQVIQTGWMNLEFRALRYLPQATQRYDIKEMDRPTPLTSQALRVQYNGSQSYLLLNDYVKVFTDNWVYLIAFQNKRVPLDFDISLSKFQKTDYPGTSRAMSYKSEVKYEGDKSALISMNEPLKYKGFYLYQASFEESPSGGAIASILSVNRDPGRVWKYLGSLMMTLGIILMFYFRKRAS